MLASDSLLTLAELDGHDPTASSSGGKRDYRCHLPACQDAQRKRNLAANVETGLWNCHRCGAKGRLVEYWEDRPRPPRPWRPRLVQPPPKAPKPATMGKPNVGAVQRWTSQTPDAVQAVHCRQNVVLTLADGTEQRDKSVWWESPKGTKHLPAGVHTGGLLYIPTPLAEIPDGATVIPCEGEPVTDATTDLGH